MIFINNQTYSYQKLSAAAETKLNGNDLKDWEFHFWSFVKEWYNDKEFIETKTSGSTGKPKIIRHQKKYCIASAKATIQFFNLQKGNTALLCLPMSSIGGKMMLVRSITAHLDLFVQEPSSNPLAYLEKEIDFTAMVPMQVTKAFDESSDNFSFIKTIIIGGGIVNNALKNKIQDSKLNAYSTFGMTETISHIALNKIGLNNDYKALEDVSFSETDENCLIIKARHLGIESLETNDIINLKDDKTFEWLGRKDNAIESGGYKFLPEVLEQKISHLIPVPFFISSLPNTKLNNEIVLVIESENAIILIDALLGVLEKYELPKKIFFLETFKYLHSGKIDKISSLNLVK